MINIPEYFKATSLEIFDCTGRKIHSYFSKNIITFSFDLSGYKSGIYVVKIKNEYFEKTIKVSKI